MFNPDLCSIHEELHGLHNVDDFAAYLLQGACLGTIAAFVYLQPGGRSPIPFGKPGRETPTPLGKVLEYPTSAFPHLPSPRALFNIIKRVRGGF